MPSRILGAPRATFECGAARKLRELVDCWGGFDEAGKRERQRGERVAGVHTSIGAMCAHVDDNIEERILADTSQGRHRLRTTPAHSPATHRVRKTSSCCR